MGRELLCERGRVAKHLRDLSYRGKAGERLVSLPRHDEVIEHRDPEDLTRPGETLGCVGCHEPRNTTSKPTAVPDTDVLSLDPPAEPQYEGGLSFVRTVQPVLDRYCIRCHGLEKTEAELNLLGTPTRRSHAGYELGFSIAYESLVGRRKLIAMAGNEAYNFGIPYKRSVPVSVL